MAELSIIPCPVDYRAEALRQLHAGLPGDMQDGLVNALQAEQQRGNPDFEGLFVALESKQLLGTVWVQIAAGQTAVFWPPALTCPAGGELLRAAAHFLERSQVALAQFLVQDQQTIDHDALAAVGFQKLAELEYLTIDSRLFPSDLPESGLSFQPEASAEPERLGALLLRTYEETRDCPGLNGVREASDVLDGYREQGTFDPRHWFFVQRETSGRQSDVGALILAAHEDAGNWELVYMGLVPEARGEGWGSQILDFAMWQAGQHGADRLVLAVDSANHPALDMYRRAGFITWDHRAVYAWLRS